MNRFKIFLIAYSAVVVLAIGVVCIILWNKLDGYQKDYDAAKAAGNPDICAESLVRELDYTALLRYIKEYGINTVGPFDCDEQHAAYFSKLINLTTPRYERSEQFTDRTPIYDIYCGDERIAVVSLKSSGKNDEFGYHLWQIKDMAFDTDIIEYSNLSITVPAGSTVTYNGMALGEENRVAEEEYPDAAVSYAVNAGGEKYMLERYEVKNVLGEPVVTAADELGSELFCEENNGEYDFVSDRYNEFLDGVKDRVYEVVDAYIMNIYRKKTFWEIAGYLEKNSDAYKVIYDVQASIAWSWKPDTVDVLEQNLTDCVYYNENLFTCSYYGRIYKFKEGAEENGEEEFKYRMMFKRINGQWVLSFFMLNT